jgi:hypothetical protein
MEWPDSIGLVLTAAIYIILFGWVLTLISGILLLRARKRGGRTLMICTGIWVLMILAFVARNWIAYR